MIGDTARNTTDGMRIMGVFDSAAYSGLPGVAISAVETGVCRWEMFTFRNELT
jgi:hypothetical protein